MIYCPKCNNPTTEMICPYCSTDVYNYAQQQNKLSNVHIDTLRSDHRYMPDLRDNQDEMLSILRKDELNDKSN